MTGLKGNSEFCFPGTLNVSRGEAEGNIEVEWQQNSLFPAGPVVSFFLLYLLTKKKTAANKPLALRRLAHKFASVSRSTI